MSIPQTARQYEVHAAGSVEGLKLVDVQVPKPKSTEVLVKIRAVSLQYRDLLVVNGAYPAPVLDNVVPGSDMAGDVVSVGEDVAEWAVGDRVMANFYPDLLHEDAMSPEIIGNTLGAAVNGVLAEYRVFPAHGLVAIPDHLSYEEASTLPCAALTAYNALIDGFEQVKAGDTLLIQGTGGVSIFGLQFAVASGATTIVISSSDAKLAVATKLGARHTINYATTPDWDAEVLRLTNGRGVDRVLEVVGNSSLRKSIAATRLGGSIDILGFLGGLDTEAAVDIIGPSIWKQLKIRGLSVGSVAQLKAMTRLMAANTETTRPVVDKVFAWAAARDAFAYMQAQNHVGKVVVRVA
ncbi:Alcohol dehydrogenase superfamily protein [Mycena indigotica]|uniref:Alcohol dehydrogenase superfamily protein n=1 Tax=Mycena indigotica TaxID=2126181 RepID=A0A8H6VRR5_9AGAR|nr:Alcohol dehydrogenase superfamily protein [Mycena indigotica]KAF7291404.1 Alcohol dehydrogenase superfamily protein [Mycena indigotica]